MNKILKYTLFNPTNLPSGTPSPFYSRVELPTIYQVLEMYWDGDSICMSILFDPESARLPTRFIAVAGDTNLTLPMDCGRYIGSIQGQHVVGRKNWNIGERIYIFHETVDLTGMQFSE